MQDFQSLIHRRYNDTFRKQPLMNCLARSRRYLYRILPEDFPSNWRLGFSFEISLWAKSSKKFLISWQVLKSISVSVIKLIYLLTMLSSRPDLGCTPSMISLISFPCTSYPFNIICRLYFVQDTQKGKLMQYNRRHLTFNSKKLFIRFVNFSRRIAISFG